MAKKKRNCGKQLSEMSTDELKDFRVILKWYLGLRGIDLLVASIGIATVVFIIWFIIFVICQWAKFGVSYG